MNFQGAPDRVLTIPIARDARVSTSFHLHEPVLGYRAWLVRPGCGGYELSGVMVPARWTAGPGVWTCAVCRPPLGSASIRHDELVVPHPDCTCGLHAYHSLATGGYDDRYTLMDAVRGIVWGAVAGAGRVIVSRDGWRAQFARPVAIVLGSASPHLVHGVAGQLGVPAVRSDDIARVAAEFGRPWTAPTPALASPARVRLDV
jgi:hypothetical protein